MHKQQYLFWSSFYVGKKELVRFTKGGSVWGQVVYISETKQLKVCVCKAVIIDINELCQ